MPGADRLMATSAELHRALISVDFAFIFGAILITFQVHFRHFRFLSKQIFLPVRVAARPPTRLRNFRFRLLPIFRIIIVSR